MSRAFVKEDVEVPERVTRRRSLSGLPPGALNFLTSKGAARLREKLRSGGNVAAEAARILASATIVEPPQKHPGEVVFGATVTLRAPDGTLRTHRIVGVDEVALDPQAVSWVSPLGRALLGAEVGKTVSLGESDERFTVLKIEHDLA